MNLLLAGSYIPNGVLIAIIALSVVIVGAVAVNIVFIVKIKKTGKANEIKDVKPITTQTEVAPPVEETETEVVEKTGVAQDTDTTEDTDDAEETATSDVLVINGREIKGRFNLSFTAKLIQAPEETKEFYAGITNYLLSFKGVKCRISWKAATFNVGRKQLAKLTVKGKTLNVNLALHPADYTELKFKTIDKSESKAYATVPLGFKVKSNRMVNNAKKLIDDIATALSLVRKENTNIITANSYPFEEIDVLIEKGLIKVKA